VRCVLRYKAALAARMSTGVNLMLLSATLALLGFWLAAVWYGDLDGFRRRRHNNQRSVCAACGARDADGPRRKE